MRRSAARTQTYIIFSMVAGFPSLTMSPMVRSTVCAPAFFHPLRVPRNSRGHVACFFVQDRHRALAVVLVNFPAVDHDQRRPILMTVLRHDAARGDRHVAQSQPALIEPDVLGGQIDRGALQPPSMGRRRR